ncbi:LemA family protein [Nocardia otitidiscaviarum]|uniref:LemA family protein n=1 Tax=Nocardia otitidiscaviarum TaxID=1823 RepID=A0A516NH52_9NOCA|nr:LemA family protein [Nocardia otitidiscaviarum]MCP9625193.1 LemA family protein [Nocardia otitidiscaviarum]QDP78231.1 LemA family protein [Nocardia otitidiscaviarum]
MAVAFVLLLLVVMVVLIVVFSAYNTFVRQRHMIEEAWRQVDVELQRRHDLIPNLVDTARIAAGFEQQAMSAVVNARSAAVRARQASDVGRGRQGQLESELSGALHGFLGLAESYPQLRSNQNFLYLQRQLAETEDRIAAGRRFFNGNVRQYNTRLQTVPSSLFASMFSFAPAEYFEIADARARQAPQIGGLWNRGNQVQPPYPPQSLPPAH